MMTPIVLARLRNVPTRLFAAFVTFGLMLGVPAFMGCVSVVLFLLELETAGAVVALLCVVMFFVIAASMWVLIFQARAKLKRAEASLYSGDFDAATRDAHFVVRTVFRSDYQMGALFTLALAAERLGAFVEAGALFERALLMVPAMAAQRPGRRVRALFSAHAAIDFAAAGDLPRASAMLARCHRELGASGQPGAFEMLLDDSYMGAIGLNSMLVEIENRRDPRPLAVLAWLLVMLKEGQAQDVLSALAHERAVLAYGLAPHEQALAARLESEATRVMSGALRAPSPPMSQPAAWADMVLPGTVVTP